MAILAKQAWRFLTCPHSLVGRLFKARYFPHTNILNARMGSNPSWTWRSIWSATGLLRMGTRWRVGNGENIRIWHDIWLPRPFTFCTITPRGETLRLEKVADIIDREIGAWNQELIRLNFLPVDVEAILSIPLGKNTADRLVCHYTRSGQFSVRSAFFLGLNLDTWWRPRDEAQRSNSARADLTLIWHSQVPPKVKLFGWKLNRNILPTKDNLVRRRVLAADNCEVCQGMKETALHTLLRCHFARQTWALSNLPLAALDTNCCHPFDWLRFVFNSLDKEGFEFFLICCWFLWFRRNSSVFGDRTFSPSEVISQARSFYARCLAAQPQGDDVFNSDRQQKWSPPSNEQLKVNVDAALFSDSQTTGLGAVARDAHGQCVKWCSRILDWPLTAEVADAMAIKMAVQLCKDNGWAQAVVESDCLGVISKLNSSDEDFSALRPILDDIRFLVRDMQIVKFSYVHREANKVARLLARNASSLRFSDDSIPFVIRDALASDMG